LPKIGEIRGSRGSAPASATVNLARALTGMGVAAELVVHDALPHSFWAQMLSPESDDAFQRMAAFLSRHTGRR
jgi:acetyl esterase/lipase